MDVFDMPTQVVLVADQMLPIATLPDAPLTASHTLGTPALVRGQATGKACFDLGPAIGVVQISLRQSPQAVQVIRENHDRKHLKPPRRMRGLKC